MGHPKSWVSSVAIFFVEYRLYRSPNIGGQHGIGSQVVDGSGLGDTDSGRSRYGDRCGRSAGDSRGGASKELWVRDGEGAQVRGLRDQRQMLICNEMGARYGGQEGDGKPFGAFEGSPGLHVHRWITGSEQWSPGVR